MRHEENSGASVTVAIIAAAVIGVLLLGGAIVVVAFLFLGVSAAPLQSPPIVGSLDEMSTIAEELDSVESVPEMPAKAAAPLREPDVSIEQTVETKEFNPIEMPAAEDALDAAKTYVAIGLGAAIENIAWSDPAIQNGSTPDAAMFSVSGVYLGWRFTSLVV